MAPLRGAGQSPRTEVLSSRLRSTNLWNIFNPSMVSTAQGVAIVFRAGRWPGDRPFRAYYLPAANMDKPPIDLTEAYAATAVKAVSDPKLFMLEDEIWVTFNTGHLEAPNRIFMARLHPMMSSPQELILPERQTIEKNWALFATNGALHAVYSVSPPIVLRARDRYSKGKISFEPLSNEVCEMQNPGWGLTLGSQLASLDSAGSDFGVVVHRKLYWGKKRAYLGLPGRVRRDGDKYAIAFGQRYLAHSPRALLGSRIRHNPHLISCTYISGLIVEDGRAILGYGINDVEAGFAELPAVALGFEPQ